MFTRSSGHWWLIRNTLSFVGEDASGHIGQDDKGVDAPLTSNYPDVGRLGDRGTKAKKRISRAMAKVQACRTIEPADEELEGPEPDERFTFAASK